MGPINLKDSTHSLSYDTNIFPKTSDLQNKKQPLVKYITDGGKNESLNFNKKTNTDDQTFSKIVLKKNFVINPNSKVTQGPQSKGHCRNSRDFSENPIIIANDSQRKDLIESEQYPNLDNIFALPIMKSNLQSPSSTVQNGFKVAGKNDKKQHIEKHKQKGIFDPNLISVLNGEKPQSNPKSKVPNNGNVIILENKQNSDYLQSINIVPKKSDTINHHVRDQQKELAGSINYENFVNNKDARFPISQFSDVNTFKSNNAPIHNNRANLGDLLYTKKKNEEIYLNQRINERNKATDNNIARGDQHIIKNGYKGVQEVTLNKKFNNNAHPEALPNLQNFNQICESNVKLFNYYYNAKNGKYIVKESLNKPNLKGKLSR